MQLRKVTLYLSDEEMAAVQAVAEDEGVTISAVLRAQLGLGYRRRGAPEGNANRQRRGSVKKQADVTKVADASERKQA